MPAVVREGTMGLVCACSFLQDSRSLLAKGIENLRGFGNVCSGGSPSFSELCGGVLSVFAGSAK